MVCAGIADELAVILAFYSKLTVLTAIIVPLLGAKAQLKMATKLHGNGTNRRVPTLFWWRLGTFVLLLESTYRKVRTTGPANPFR